MPFNCEHIFEDDRPFAQCHASTLVQLSGDRFLVAWFGGTHEGHDDVGIWAADRSEVGWSSPRLLAKVAPEPHWNPVLFRAPAVADAPRDSAEAASSLSRRRKPLAPPPKLRRSREGGWRRRGEVHLFFKVGPTVPTWHTWAMISDDDGRTWGAPHELVPGDRLPRGPVKNKPIVLSDGAWLAPGSVETDAAWDVFVDRSEDGGETWRAGGLVARDRAGFEGKGVIQPTIWESEPGCVHMLMRSTCGRICRSDSRDGGLTWSPIYRTDLPNNNSGIDLARLSDGTLVLVYNAVNQNWGRRSPLSVALSTDNGNSWCRPRDLETGPGEYSYPAVIPTAEGWALTYTCRRERIAFWQGSIGLVLG
jgi:predicted neuraminidase